MARRTNDEWVAALRGDLGQRAQEAAYSDLGRYLYRVAYNYLGSRKDGVPGLCNKSGQELADLAEEFTQDTLLRTACERLYSRYRGEGRFLAFMAAIAINEVRQELRRKKWQVCEEPLPPSEPEYDSESGDSLPQLESVVSTELGPETQQELQAVWDAVRRCVERLPVRWRRAFVWRVFEDLPTTEVQDRLNASSEGAVHILVSRARSRLKACLVEAGWNLDDIWGLFS